MSFPAEDTSPVHAGNFEVIQELHHFLSVGVTGITVSHLQHRNTQGKHKDKKGFTKCNSDSMILRTMCVTYRFEQLDLVQGGLCVMFCTFYNLHGHKALLPEEQPEKTVMELITIT